MNLWGRGGKAYREPPTTSCSSGLGYTMLTDGNAVSFTGSAVNSAIQQGTAPYNTPYIQNRMDWGGGGWNLLGNPFTSAMNASLFISTNSSSLDPSYQAVYIYDGSDYFWIASAIPGYPGKGHLDTHLFRQARVSLCWLITMAFLSVLFLKCRPITPLCL